MLLLGQVLVIKTNHEESIIRIQEVFMVMDMVNKGLILEITNHKTSLMGILVILVVIFILRTKIKEATC